VIERRLRLVALGLVDRRVDHREDLALFHLGAVVHVLSAVRFPLLAHFGRMFHVGGVASA
jgi:hypothetical protein